MPDTQDQGSQGGSAQGGTTQGGEGQEHAVDQLLEGAIIHLFRMKSKPVHPFQL